jgi:hypothetical protein
MRTTAIASPAAGQALPGPWWRRLALSLALAVLGLAGCMLMPERVPLGTPHAEIVQRLGRPTAEYPLPDGGRRLQYSMQPAGEYVYNLDLDASGRLRQVQQVMDADWLQRHVQVGRWTREDALFHLGKPALVERVARFRGDVWTYRFLEAGNLRRLAHLHIDPEGVVRILMFTDEPYPDPPPDRS